MKKSIGVSLIIAFAMIMSLFVFKPYTYNSYADSLAVAGYHLYDLYNNNEYLSTSALGEADGYGRFELGDEGATLNANAYEGNEIVGFKIILTHDDSKSIFIDNQNLIDGQKSISEGYDFLDGQTITVNFSADEAFGGHYTRASLHISKVFADLIVYPVFDYIYYNVEIDEQSFNLFKHENSLNVLDNTIYYTNFLESENKYTNAILKSQDKYYFVGDIYAQDTSFYYTQKPKNDGSDENVKIDIMRGAFRLNETVEAHFDVDMVDYADGKTAQEYSQKQNLDITNLKIQSGQDIQTVAVAADRELNSAVDAVKTLDELKRTTAVSIRFAVKNTPNTAQTISFGYNQFFVASVVIKLDGEEVSNQKLFASDPEGSLFTFLTADGNITVSEYVSKIEKDKFFVQSAQPSIKIDAPKNFNYRQGEEYFTYYILNTIDGEQTTSKTFNLEQDTQIVVELSTVKYEVNFSLRVINEFGALQPLDLLTSFTAKSLTRGEGFNLTRENADSFIGYNFLGYSQIDNEAEINSGKLELVNPNFNFTLSEQTPKSTTILLIYKKIDYTIKFENYNSQSLTDTRGNTIYAVNEVNLTVNDTLAERITGGLSAEKDAFATLLHLGDNITISTIINDGFTVEFNIKSASAGEDKLIQNSLSFSQPIDEDFITNFIDENGVITISLTEGYVLYNFTYYILPNLDFNQNKQVIMANLSLTHNGEKIEESTPIPSGGQQITIPLRKYEKVTLSSAGITTEEETENYTYIFQYFKEDGTSFHLTTNEKIEDGVALTNASTDFIVLKETSVQVVYQMPTIMLTLSLAEGDGDAFVINAESVSISQNDSVVELLNIESGTPSAILSPGSATIILQNINFGFDLVGATINSLPVELQKLEGQATTSYQLDVEITEQLSQNLVLDFNAIEYRLYITNNNGEFIKFDEQDYTILSARNQTIDFVLPEGYYVSATDNLFTDTLMAQDNSFVGDNYHYTLMDGEFNYLVNLATSEDDYYKINLNFTFTIHTYDVTINYKVADSSKDKFLDRLTFPPVSLSYTVGEQAEPIIVAPIKNDVLHNVIFSQIPYGAKIDILVSEQDYGIRLFRWDNITSQANIYNAKIEKLTENKNLGLVFTYRAYTVVLEYNDAQANPEIFVNDKNSNSVTLFDKLTIRYNQYFALGYQFKNIYVQYNYSEDSWNNGFDIYIYNPENKTFRLAEPNYVEGLTYVKPLSTNSLNEYEIESFNTRDFNISNYLIKFYIECRQRGITLTNNTVADFNLVVVEGGESYTVDKSSISTYTVLRNGEVVDASAILTSSDEITIKIELNSIVIDGVTYYYRNGLSLLSVMLQDQTSALVNFNEHTGVYQFSFNMSNVIAQVPENDVLVLNYYYSSSQKTVNITTNVMDPAFYKSGGSVNFNMTYDESRFQAGPSRQSSNGNASLTERANYLSKVVFVYNFSANYANNFFVSGITVDDQTYTEAELLDLGIQILREKEGSDEITGLAIRFINNYNIKWIIQPIITINQTPDAAGNYFFTSTYACTSSAVGLEQNLTVGPSPSSNIQCASELGVTLSYVLDGVSYNKVVDVAQYFVKLTFNSTSYSWLNGVELNYKIYFEITPRQLYLTYLPAEINTLNKLTKIYDTNATLSDFSQYVKYIRLTDNAGLSIKYEDCLGKLILNYNQNALITATVGEEEVNSTDYREQAYNLKIYGFNLENNPNFKLMNDVLIIRDVVNIEQATIYIQGLEVYDKVYDGNNEILIKSQQNLSLSGVFADDEVTFDASNIKLTIDDYQISTKLKDKTVLVDFTNFLTGAKAHNYKLSNITNLKATVYPDQISATIDGATISVVNVRGKQNPEYANLIPLGSSLSITPILRGTNDYENMLPKIESLLTNNREFAKGYVIRMVENNVSKNLDNRLHLVLPYLDNFLGAIYLAGDYSGEIATEVNNGQIVIDLSGTGFNIDTIILTRQRELFKLWQLILIIVCAVIVVIAIIVALVIIRKKRIEESYKREKI